MTDRRAARTRTRVPAMLATAALTVGGTTLGLAAPVTALGATTVAPGAEVVAVTAAAAEETHAGYEKRVRHWINVRRDQHGLSQLGTARCATRLATRWSEHLVRTDGFHHRDMQVVLNRCEATWAGETLGKGSITPRRLVRMWMDSPGHRAILLAEQPGHFGVGTARAGDGQLLTTANFIRR